MSNRKKTATVGNSPYIHCEEEHNLKAPSIIVPDLIEYLRPRSVVDVGCGIGTFLCVFQKSGIDDIVGLDGNWVNRSLLAIDEKYFIETDLDKPLDLGRRFDLVVSLEVAEHLAPESADRFVDDLCKAGDVVVFSAAVVGQGGQNHTHEQHPAYWQAKFEARGYHFYDVFRERYWDESEIDWWYRQNMFLAARDQVVLPPEVAETRVDGAVRSYIHPELLRGMVIKVAYLEGMAADSKSLGGIARRGARFIKRRLWRPTD